MDKKIVFEQKTTVDKKTTAKYLGSGTLDVYATPAMIAFIENTCMKSVESLLGPGECTVGTLIDAQHIAASPVGMEIVCSCELISRDRKRLIFEATVSDSMGVIGKARHERFIVDEKKFMSKTNEKLNLK